MARRRPSPPQALRHLFDPGGEVVDDSPLTAPQRAALDARDRALTERFLAGNPAAAREMVQRLNALGRLVALRFWRRLYFSWEEHRGEYFATLHRYREEGKLRPNESLRFLAQRLLKHVGRKLGIEAHRELVALSLQGKRAPLDVEGRESREIENAKSWTEWLEIQVTSSAATQPRFADAETALGDSQIGAELATVAERLDPMERKTFEAERAVANGEHDCLADALGVSDVAARQRRLRMRRALSNAARREGNRELARRIEGGRRRKAR